MAYMSEEGYKKLMAELKELETVERPKISAAIALSLIHIFTAFVGADVEMGSYHFYPVYFRVDKKWYLFVFGYFKISFSVQLYVSFLASEVGCISQSRL